MGLFFKPPKTLVFGTPAKHPGCRRHKPRSKTMGLLNVSCYDVRAISGFVRLCDAPPTLAFTNIYQQAETR
jgi:hypothetical protein